MEHVWLSRWQTLLFFGKASKLNPSSSLQMFCMGDIGIICSLMGDDFYRSLATLGLSVFHEVGVFKVYAAISDGHLRLLTRALKTVDVQPQGFCKINGHDLNWIRLTAKSDTQQRELFDEPDSGQAEALEMGREVRCVAAPTSGPTGDAAGFAGQLDRQHSFALLEGQD